MHAHPVNSVNEIVSNGCTERLRSGETSPDSRREVGLGAVRCRILPGRIGSIAYGHGPDRTRGSECRDTTAIQAPSFSPVPLFAPAFMADQMAVADIPRDVDVPQQVVCGTYWPMLYGNGIHPLP